MDVIWSSSKAMELMTASQLQHYQIDCKQYQPKLAVQYIQDFKSYLSNFIKMFDYSMESKKVTKNLDINTLGLRLKFYTDMRLYESILFHIFSNAVKFSPSGSVVTIEVELK